MEQPQIPQQNWTAPPAVPVKHFFPAQMRELLFGIFMLVICCLLCNSMLLGGFHLGFAIFACLSLLCTGSYLLASGKKLTLYSGALLILSLIIAASFARSDDGFVKFVMFCFLLIGSNLSLCLIAGQNRRSPKGFLSLGDVFRTLFSLGLGKLPQAFRGLGNALRKGGTAAKRGGSVLLGLVIAIPILGILIPLLMRADAAFEAVLDLLPEWDLAEIIATIILGTSLACWLYTRGTALQHTPTCASARATIRKGVNPLTVNTVLVAVAVVYLAYLLSQLAYFSGGLAGILPEEYTLAEYARRGFFEMAWLCAVNLTVMALAVGLVSKQTKTPLATRLLCLFIGIVTLFLVVTASAKMFMYIASYGLTRLRVLTEVIMIFLGLTTLIVTLWLFVPKLPYMKVILLAGLLIGAAVSWADVDTVVARYNVTAYRSGTLDTVDVQHLRTLGDGAVPYLYELTQDSDPEIAKKARNALEVREREIEDYRSWNYASALAEQYLPEPEGA